MNRTMHSVILHTRHYVKHLERVNESRGNGVSPGFQLLSSTKPPNRYRFFEITSIKLLQCTITTQVNLHTYIHFIERP